MLLPQFKIENQRSIRLAECTVVPRLMVVAGPNGAGKSTLLDALRRQASDGTILYVGPHRNARRQHVQWRHLLSADISLEALLARSDEIAAAWGCSRMRMTVISLRKELIEYYERRGYMKTGLAEPFPENDPRFGLPKIKGLLFVELAKQLSIEKSQG